jgi:murein DD-endopeptidase MepM/ murein hydrolase activator NlpD
MSLIVPLLEPQMTSVFSMPLTLTLLLLLHASAVGAQRCADLAGDFRQGGLLWGQVTPSAHVALDDASILVLPNGTFVLGLGRDAPKEQVFSVVAEGQRCTQTVAVAQRQYNIQRVEGVPQKTVTPPNDVLERIARERALVRKAKAQRIERPELLEAVRAGLSWPATGRISGVYGSQRFYNGTPGSPHYGVDVAVPTGHPVVAPGPGVITLAEVDLFYSGGTIILDHGYGLSSSFLHLSKLHVEVGQEVQRGDLIGEVGATGRATGPHLDWRMSWLNQRVDPQLLVPAMPLPD